MMTDGAAGSVAAASAPAGSPSADDVRRLLGEALRRPAQEGARLMALHWLHQLAAARDAWQSWRDTAVGAAGSDDVGHDDRGVQILHKARVALRRLRATLRENDRVLDGAVDRRLARVLRALGRATNAARDADVQRSWLEAEQAALPEDVQQEARMLLARLGGKSADTGEIVDDAFESYFDPYFETLRARLGSYALLQRVGMDTHPMPFARHLATRVSRAANRLRRDIEHITDVQAQEPMHEVRIRLKRQRALLAPFARTRPAIGAWFELATRGQDLLGAIRDADLLARRARKAGLRALEGALRDVVLGHYAAFRHDWCERLDDVAHVMDAAANALRGEGMPSSAGGLPVEIERKFLLRACPPAARAVLPFRIEQGWIPGTHVRERLRRRIAPDGTITCFRTIKLGQAVARVEVEEATSPELFEAMWPLTAPARIRKDRYVVPHGPHTWEIDVFHGRDLVLAEVELGHEQEQVTLPPWLAPYVEREVTTEPAYFNAVLARPDA